MAVSVGGTSETSCSWPTHASGDWGFLFVEHGGGTVATPTNCSIIPGFPVNQGGGSILSGFQIIATSSSMPALALAGGSNHMLGAIVAVSGADAGDPVAAVAFLKQSGTTTNGAMPGLVTYEDGLTILNILAWSADNAGPLSSAEANASLSSVTEQLDSGTISGDGGGLLIISGTQTTAGVVSMTTSTLSTASAFSAATLAIRPAIATPYTVSDTVTIDGAAAPNGGTVEVWDTIDGVLAGTTTISGGAGGFSLAVPYNDANRYRVVYDDGSSYGASPKGTAT